MDAARRERIETLLAQARALSPDRRAPFLGAACDGDATLRAEVEAHLGEDSPGPAATEPKGPTTTRPDPTAPGPDAGGAPARDLVDSIALEALTAPAPPARSRGPSDPGRDPGGAP